MQRWYWCGQTSNVVHVDDNETDLPDYGDRASFFEPTVSDRNVGIKIRNLTKVFNYIWLYIATSAYTSRLRRSNVAHTSLLRRSILALTALDPLRVRPASSEFPDGAIFAPCWSDVHDKLLICSGVRMARGARARGIDRRSSTTP